MLLSVAIDRSAITGTPVLPVAGLPLVSRKNTKLGLRLRYMPNSWGFFESNQLKLAS